MDFDFCHVCGILLDVINVVSILEKEYLMSIPVAVTDESFEVEVLQADRPVLTDFWAEWCGPCKAIAPVLEEIAGEYAEQMKVVKLDVGTNSVIPTQFGVMHIPTLILFVDGKPVERLVGALSKSSLVDKIKSHLV